MAAVAEKIASDKSSTIGVARCLDMPGLQIEQRSTQRRSREDSRSPDSDQRFQPSRFSGAKEPDRDKINDGG